MNGVDELITWSGKITNSDGGREGRSFGSSARSSIPSKGILGVDVGASATTVAASFGGEFEPGCIPATGSWGSLAILRYTSLNEIMNWIPLELEAEVVRDYLFQIPVSRQCACHTRRPGVEQVLPGNVCPWH